MSSNHAGSISMEKKDKRVESRVESQPILSEAAPDGGYGWVCVIAAAIVNAHSWGFNTAYAIFLAYYLDHEVFAGASRLEYALVGSLSLTTTFLVSPVATHATEKYGIRPTMFTGVIFETASLLCASAVSKIWQLFLTQGVLFGMGLGMMFVPVAAVVPQWFTSKRSLASGVSLSGAGLGGLVYSLATQALIRNLGLDWAYRILGVLAFVVNTSCVLLIKDRAKVTRGRRATMEVSFLKDVNFNLLVAFSVFTIFGYFILIFSLADYGIRIGLTPSQASLISGLFNLGQAVGRPCIGYFSDRVGRINIAGITTLLAGIVCLVLWTNAKSYGLLVFFAVFEGLVAGNFWATIAPLVAQICGIGNVAGGMNLIWLSIIVPATFSEPIALRLAGNGTYLTAQLFTGIMYIAASICLGVLFFRWRPRT